MSYFEDDADEAAGSSDGFQPPYAAGSMAMADPRVPFSDFLRDIIFPLSDPPRMAEEVQGLAVLDFCDDTNLELNDIDFGVLDNWEHRRRGRQRRQRAGARVAG